MNSCAVLAGMGVVRNVLAAVECNTRGFARLGYESLTAADSPFQTILTLVLTLYVAVLGYRLIFAKGNARLSDGPGIALKVGAILALVTSWSVFQTLVFDVAQSTPIEIASVISAPLRGDSALAANPVDGLQTAYDQLTMAADRLNKKATPTSETDVAQNTSKNTAAAANLLSLAANALFFTSVGFIAIITVSIGVLTATGPLFITLYLFPATKGFFVGWVRALAGAAFCLLTTWTLNILMLYAIGPWLETLSGLSVTDMPDVQAAISTSSIVLVFAASQIGLVLAGFVVARGFHDSSTTSVNEKPAPEVKSTPLPIDVLSRPAKLAQQLAYAEARMDQPLIAGSLVGMARRVPASAAVANPAYSRSDEPYRRPGFTRSQWGTR